MKKLLQSLFVLLFVCVAGYAQAQTVTGKVTSADDNLPIPGVSVKVKGASGGVATDAKGSFTIIAAKGTTLIFSSIGFATQEVTVGSGPVNVQLASDSKQLSEIVVTAMGLSRQSSAVGYSTTKVDPNKLLQKSEPDMLKSLQGKVAGVDIRTSQGTPGAATRIQIRGNSSFFGDNQPLIVVDGIPYSNDQITTSSQTSGGGAYSSGLGNLDPNDIASMQILKGSAAGALYGSRASNGVILITTKSGSGSYQNQPVSATFKSSASVENVANLPSYQNSYGAGSNFTYSNSNGSWGPAFSALTTIPTWPAYANYFGTATIPYQAYPNNVKDLFRTGSVFENSISITGGGANSSVALTASRLSQDGYVDNAGYNRTSLGAGGKTTTKFGLSLGANLSYTKSNQNGGVFGENQVDGAASQFARTLFLARNWDLNLPYENNETPNGGGQFDNPRWSARHNTVDTQEERFITNFNADIKVYKWITAVFRMGGNIHSLNRRQITDIGSRAAEGLGRLVTDNYRKQEIESTVLLNFDPKIDNDFTLTGTLGFNSNSRKTSRQLNTGNRFITPGIFTLKNTSQQEFSNDNISNRRLYGAFGEATVGYKNYAFLTFTGRNDWSSTLPASNRSYFYPSVSGSFVFSEALKMDSKILDYGKIRAGYAKVGRDASPYSLADVFVIGTNFMGQSTASIDGTSNDPLLKPEFTKELEIGTNLSFLKSRLTLDLAWYDKKSTNLIAPISTPASSGFDSYYTNFGAISNKGVEVELTGIPVKSNNFSWSITGVFTKNKNIVTELTNGVTRLPLAGVLTTIAPYAEVGMPYGYLRGSRSLRDAAGNLLIDSSTGMLIEDTEQGMVGNPNPDYKLGITNAFKYKNFTLGVLFDMTKGGDLYSVTISSLLGRGVTTDTEDRLKSWVIPGVYGDPNTKAPILDGNGNTIPNITRITTNDLYFGNTFAVNSSTEWNVYDATVYRLREVTLGYTFPKSMFRKLPIGSLNLSLSARNLWYIAPNVPKGSNFDPETNSFGATNVQGIELSAAPTTRRYGVNLSVTF
ncbi:SusC/RagA family TonB-linked outer membrane protein [Pedobacter xixiisoli]|uniref:TonB-linked outer membrane protein, SusC/RagA family n=1 Tax=Pedobacter xixiisoli TaxID=1476464 RepID=A0A286ADT3_9SPHI|nr:SusC/RagA family TonB-linked outer membrane protein [Pedobacter xixiisoli]SOD20043.1 TonB-linked outer membrane protein, SusC/RagA family [Pedobacter xixiisoli]